MGRAQRRKGGVGEREVAAIFREHGWPEAKRSGDAGQLDGDLDHTDPFYVEVRRRERLDIPAWLREIAEECPADKRPLLVFRRSREGWHACLPLHDFLGLIQLLKQQLDHERKGELHGRDGEPAP